MTQSAKPSERDSQRELRPRAQSDITVETYASAIGAALDISREQTLAIIANLNLMDLLAK